MATCQPSKARQERLAATHARLAQALMRLAVARNVGPEEKATMPPPPGGRGGAGEGAPSGGHDGVRELRALSYPEIATGNHQVREDINNNRGCFIPCAIPGHARRRGRP
jgi:hypothetical protein